MPSRGHVHNSDGKKSWRKGSRGLNWSRRMQTHFQFWRLACKFRTPRRRLLWYGALAALGVTALAICLTAGFLIIMRLRWEVALHSSDNVAIASVNGTVDHFTLLVMTYSARILLLHQFIRHYQCASVHEILVVWNEGPVPEVSDFDSSLPVRIRVETANSLNNRYRLDSLLKTKAVLSLDDDIFMPCGDIERAFAHWRTNPNALVGFHPRLAEGRPLTYTPERNAVFKGSYNLILTGSAFIDASRYFPLYSNEANAANRALVDKLFNCDDVLMNFVAAKHNPGGPYLEFIRPTMRIDLSFTSGTPRLSGSTVKHGNKRSLCLQKFEAAFGGALSKRPMQQLIWGERGPPLCFLSRLVGCLFL